MRLLRRATGVLLACAACLGAAEEPDPTPEIEAFHAALLEVMQLDGGFEARRSRLEPVVAGLFDLPNIARISLGRTWQELDEAGRAQFTALLEALIVATYADRFDSYGGQRFHTLEARPARRGWVVRTELEKSDGERVSLDYYLRNGLVFNVVADGVSDLSLRRADYSSIVKNEGYPALLAHIRGNIAEAEQGAGG